MDGGSRVSLDDKTKAALAEFLSEFVQHPSEAPKDGEARVEECMSWLRATLERWGWGPYIHMWEASPGEPNIAVRLPGRSGRANLMFNGHADVVPVSPDERDNWVHPPYSGEIHCGNVWGRGSSDMKGGIAAFLWASKMVWESHRGFAHDLILTINIGEESGHPEVGVKSVIAKGYAAPVIVNAEPTNLRICRAAPGWFFFQIEVSGKSTHPANKFLCLDPNVPLGARPGIDAVDKLRRIQESLARLEATWHSRSNELFPKYSMNMTCVYVQAGTRAARIADSAIAVYAVLFHPGHSSSEVIAEIHKAMDDAAQSDEWLQGARPTLTVPVVDPIWEPFELPDEHEGVRQMKDAVHRVTGHGVETFAFPGPCDANMIAKAGHHVLIFGPGDLSFGCHGVNEFVPLDQVFKATLVYADMIERRCQNGGEQETIFNS